MARIQPCLRKLGIDFGYESKKEIWPQIITERNRASFLHNNHFYLISKSENFSFN